MSDVLLPPCRDKINELYEWMCQLESEKFDHMERLKRQKYEVRRCCTRVYSLNTSQYSYLFNL